MPKRENQDTPAIKHNKKTKKDPIPDSLIRLQSKFEAVNIFNAFCDARLTSSVTLTSLERAVPGLTCQDLAAINVVIPSFVHFNVISSETIEVEFGKPVSKKVSKEKHSQAIKNRGEEWNQFKKKEVVVKPNVIKKMIEQQNNLFKKSMSTFLQTCQEKSVDPDQFLLRELEKQMPCPVIEDDDAMFGDDIDLDERKSMVQVIEGLKSLKFYGGQLQDTKENTRTFPDKHADYGDIELSEPIVNALLERGIEQLYIHQTEALIGLFDGHHVIVSTSTASGKSLIYQIPALESLLKDKTSKAMYIFPTKALAQDQKRALEELIHQIPQLEDIMVSTFDGDTPSDQRTFIRENANVIFTNPDMIHHSILPNGKRWGPFFTNLKYVVVDELHVYHGLFGTHIAFIMRRLRRLCGHYHNHLVQFISCSATIQNPDAHMKTIFGIEHVKLVSQDGAPHGKKEFIIWNPALVNPIDDMSERKSAVYEGALLFEYLLDHNVRTIAFCKVRKTCELLMKQLRENLVQKQKQGMMNKVMSYRGGYTPHDRRRIEKQMFNGELLGIIATNALELGVDIGTLDAVLMVGVPWSVSALWQQSGRSGRRNADSLSIIVCDGHPMDQYYASHPTILFEKQPEEVSVQLTDSIILESHIQCAAEEIPIDLSTDVEYFGPELVQVCRDHLVKIEHDLYRPAPRFRPYPSKFVNIRNINEGLFAVVDVTDHRNVVIEEIEAHRASFEIYEGAIFIHQGRSYLVQECNIDKRFAKVCLTRVDWTTVQRDYINVDAESTDETKHLFGTKNFVCFGKIKVSTIVFGYYRLDKKRRILDSHDVYMDPIIMYSTGLWVDAPAATLIELYKLDIDPMAAIHAASHCLISLLPRVSYSAVTDLRTECKNPSAARYRPARIALYETQPSGVVRQAFKHFEQLVTTCIEQIKNCPCEDGCPTCVHLPQCPEHNQVCSKEGALMVLSALRILEQTSSQ